MSPPALQFRSVGEFDLALQTLANPDYKRDLSVLGEAARKDFAQDLLLIATDAGCLKTASGTAGDLCHANPIKKCQLAVERYCILSGKLER
jgi:hypothetical protein